MTFDVVIPTFNHAPLLRKALESLLAQTHGDWRAYVVNNFSTDETIEVITSLDDARINRIDFANEGVIGAARNIGIRAGSAPYVAFLDSDDVWYPRKLERVMTAFVSGVDVVCHAEYWVEPNGESRVVRYGRGKPVTFESLLYEGNSLSTSAITMRRSLVESLDGFSTDRSFITAEDYDLWLRAAKSGASFVTLDEALGEFRRRDESESSRIARNVAAETAVVSRHFPSRPAMNDRWRRRRRLALVDYGAARSYQRTGSLGEALKGFGRAIRRFPFLPRACVALGMLSLQAMTRLVTSRAIPPGNRAHQ
ncbi:MAG: glycosyltransferase family 2 protein [Actinomycetota bacterium]